ncbi:PmoA family protein [Tundrisphaera sp. TA3]|uniref:DUF6807 domain-containing protein n=1 Tax=Tundrisphaera sp. TA3 TaxID=3435775 RepID=UPI003EC10367
MRSPALRPSGLLLLAACSLILPQSSPAQADLPAAKPVPRMQVIPLDGDRASIRRDGVELTVFHFGPNLERPFLFPLNGPAGRSLTRMGHPHDPEGHSHHNSVWLAHNDLNGENFWLDTGAGRVVHRKIIRFDDSDDAARIVAEADWVGKEGRVLMTERRGITVRPLDQGQWLLLIDAQFTPGAEPAVLGKTPFGLIGVRMAKTIGINDGGGRIRNSEGQEGEKGPNNAFRTRARWLDYSGPIANGVAEGITLLDHPANPHHPTAFHVRGDGWMGASLTMDDAITITRESPLRLRYGLLVHAGVPAPEAVDRHWKAFAAEPIVDLPAK